MSQANSFPSGSIGQSDAVAGKLDDLTLCGRLESQLAHGEVLEAVGGDDLGEVGRRLCFSAS